VGRGGGFLGDLQVGFLFGGHFRGRALFGGPGRRDARRVGEFAGVEVGLGDLVSARARDRFARCQRGRNRRRAAEAFERRFVFDRVVFLRHVAGVGGHDRVPYPALFRSVGRGGGFLGDLQFGFLFGGHFRGRALFGGPGRRDARRVGEFAGVEVVLGDLVCARARDRFARCQRGRDRRRAAEAFQRRFVFHRDVVQRHVAGVGGDDRVGDHVAHVAVRFRAGFLGDRQFRFL